jgi:hypothetical protein
MQLTNAMGITCQIFLFQKSSSIHNLPRKYWSCQGWHFQVDVTKNMDMCTKMKQLGANMQDQETIVLILFLDSMNYFNHFKAQWHENIYKPQPIRINKF